MRTHVSMSSPSPMIRCATAFACLAIVLVAVAAGLAWGAAPASAATYVWQGGNPECLGDRISFGDTLNWLPWPGLGGPGSGDTCLALTSGDSMVIGGDEEVGAIQGFLSVLVESGGSLKVNGSTGDSDIGQLTLSGKLTNTGKLALAACNAFADIDNSGTLTLSSLGIGGIVCTTGVVVNSGTIELSGEGGIAGPSIITVDPVVENRPGGTIKKTAGVLSSISASLWNQGSIVSTCGTLELSGGDSGKWATGSYRGDGGTVKISEDCILDSGAKLLGGVLIDNWWSPSTVSIVTGATVPASGVNTFKNATLSGPGTLQVPAGATLVADCAGSPSLKGLTLDTSGRIKITGTGSGGLSLESGATITNKGTIDFASDDDMDAVIVGTIKPTVISTGTITKSQGQGTSELSVPLRADGPTTAVAGVLCLSGGNANDAASVGSFEGTAPGVVTIASAFKLGSGAKLLGGVLIDNWYLPNTVTIVGGATVPASGVNTIKDATLSGPGTLQVPAGSTFVTDCAGNPKLSAAVVDNQGVLAVKASAGNSGSLSVVNSTTITNAGTLEFRGDASMFTNGDITSSLVNSGTLSKTTGTGTSEMEVSLAGSGLVKSTKGTMRVTGGTAGTATISFGGAAGTVMLSPGAQRFRLGNGAKLLGGVVLDASNAATPVQLVAGATVPATGVNTLADGTLAGPGTLQVPAASTFIADCSGSPKLSGLAVDNQGVLAVKAGPSNGCRLEVLSSTTISNPGTIEFRGDSSIWTGGDITSSLVNSGTLSKTTGTGTSEMELSLDSDGLVNAAAGTLELTGPLANFDSGTGTLTGGSWAALGSGILQLNGANVSVNAADLVLSGAGAKIAAANGGDSLAALATNTDTGALTVEGGASLSIPSALANAGSVTIGEGSTLTVAGPYTQTAGVTDLGAGTAALVSTGASAGVTATGGVVSGNGSVTPALTNSAEVSPDGVLTAGGYVQSSAGKLTVDVASTTVGSGYDRMAAGTAPVTLAGALDIQTAPGYTPALGDTFTIVTGASVAGRFNGVTGAAPAPGVAYSVVYGPTSVSLRVTDGSGAPGISSLNPASGYIGKTVTVTGTGFHADRGTGGVFFGSTAATVSSWSDTSIAVVVPAGLSLGQTAITVVTAGGVSPPASFTVVAVPSPKPVLTKISPTRGRIGTVVTLTGANFGARRGTSIVRFGSKTAASYSSWSATKIRVKVPKGTAKGIVRISVKTAAGTSATMRFKRL